MSEMKNLGMGAIDAESFAQGVKNRMRYLMLAGMLTIALIFGISFYVALLSNQSAVARQLPELEGVAAKLKSILMVNTIAIVAIIIASFFLLASIVTSRMFRPLVLLHRDLLALSEKKLPRRSDVFEGGPFSALERTWHAALAAIHEKESKEIKELADCSSALSHNAPVAAIAQKLREISDRKKAFVGASEPSSEPTKKETPKDPLFIQPV